MKFPEPLKKIARRLVRPGVRPRRVRSGALKGRLLNLDLRTDTQVWRGIYEQPLQVWLQRHVRPGDVCVDVGAAEGQFTLLMAILAGRGGRVVAFEPSHRGDQIDINLGLNRDIALAPVDRIQGYACATAAPAVAADGTPQRSVSDVFAERGFDRCDVLKIDVDGGEVDVLNGMLALLERYRPHIAIEVHTPQLRDGVLSALTPLGYELIEVAPPAFEHRPLPFNPTLFSVKRPDAI